MKPKPKGELHPRNRHQGRYHLDQLIRSFPELQDFAKKNPKGEESIDFANPRAVKALNRALLFQYYGIQQWDIPEQYLCPPVPGRADYIHHLADLLAVNTREIPRGETFRILDVGVGANCIYPIIGHGEYGWTFVGTDIDPVALESARKIIDANANLRGAIELRLQKSPPHIFKGVWDTEERFDLTMCNPPFHSSQEEADQVNLRKWRNLGKAAVANFGGQNHELWCEGGEVAFVGRMIEESVTFQKQCLWFSSLVSKETSLPAIYAELKRNKVLEYRVIDMTQGQKKSRLVAWTFLGGKSKWRM